VSELAMRGLIIDVAKKPSKKACQPHVFGAMPGRRAMPIRRGIPPNMVKLFR